MGCALLLAALLSGAPHVDPEGARLLKQAWASRYEWKEDNVATIQFDLSCKIVRTSPKSRSTNAIVGSAVVSGGKTVRIFFPGAGASEEVQAKRAFEWALGRFVIQPFDEAFKKESIAKPEPLGGGGVKVKAGKEEFWIRDGKLLGVTVGKNHVDFTLEKAGGGYCVSGERQELTTPQGKMVWSWSLVLGKAGDVPVPVSATLRTESPSGGEEVVLTFTHPRINAKDAVVGDPAARDLLKAAWGKRYTLPDDIHIDGTFVRKPDPAVRRSIRVEGEFQVWGMDKVTVLLKNRHVNKGWQATLQDQVQKDFRRFFDFFRATPFEKQFANCGFSMTKEKEFTLVRVVGYPHALAFRIEDGFIQARRENVQGPEAWWLYRGRERNGKFLVESMSRTIDKKKYEVRIHYRMVHGIAVPRAFGAFTEGWRSSYGVDEYQLTAQTQLPRKK